MAAGGDYDRFWRHSLREIDLILDGAALRMERGVKLRRRAVYELGQLVMIGFNNPRKFPKPEDFFADPLKHSASSPEEIRAFFKEHGTEVPAKK